MGSSGGVTPVEQDTSPRREAIERAQAELRRELAARYERQRELEFLEKGGNLLDFKFGEASTLVSPLLCTDDITRVQEVGTDASVACEGLEQVYDRSIDENSAKLNLPAAGSPVTFAKVAPSPSGNSVAVKLQYCEGIPLEANGGVQDAGKIREKTKSVSLAGSALRNSGGAAAEAGRPEKGLGISKSRKLTENGAMRGLQVEPVVVPTKHADVPDLAGVAGKVTVVAYEPGEQDRCKKNKDATHQGDSSSKEEAVRSAGDSSRGRGDERNRGGRPPKRHIEPGIGVGMLQKVTIDVLAAPERGRFDIGSVLTNGDGDCRGTSIKQEQLESSNADSSKGTPISLGELGRDRVHLIEQRRQPPGGAASSSSGQRQKDNAQLVNARKQQMVAALGPSEQVSQRAMQPRKDSPDVRVKMEEGTGCADSRMPSRGSLDGSARGVDSKQTGSQDFDEDKSRGSSRHVNRGGGGAYGTAGAGPKLASGVILTWGTQKDPTEAEKRKFELAAAARKAHELWILEEAEALKAAEKHNLEWVKRKKTLEPTKKKCHWDFVVEEMVWLAKDFMQERLWKRMAAAQTAKWVAESQRAKGKGPQDADAVSDVRGLAADIAQRVCAFWHEAEVAVSVDSKSTDDASAANPCRSAFREHGRYDVEGDNGAAKGGCSSGRKTKGEGGNLAGASGNPCDERGRVDAIIKNPVGKYAVRMVRARRKSDQAEAPKTPDSDEEGAVMGVTCDAFPEEPLFYAVPEGSLSTYCSTIEGRHAKLEAEHKGRMQEHARAMLAEEAHLQMEAEGCLPPSFDAFFTEENSPKDMLGDGFFPDFTSVDLGVSTGPEASELVSSPGLISPGPLQSGFSMPEVGTPAGVSSLLESDWAEKKDGAVVPRRPRKMANKKVSGSLREGHSLPPQAPSVVLTPSKLIRGGQAHGEQGEKGPAKLTPPRLGLSPATVTRKRSHPASEMNATPIGQAVVPVKRQRSERAAVPSRRILARPEPSSLWGSPGLNTNAEGVGGLRGGSNSDDVELDGMGDALGPLTDREKKLKKKAMKGGKKPTKVMGLSDMIVLPDSHPAPESASDELPISSKRSPRQAPSFYRRERDKKRSDGKRKLDQSADMVDTGPSERVRPDIPRMQDNQSALKNKKLKRRAVGQPRDTDAGLAIGGDGLQGMDGDVGEAEINARGHGGLRSLKPRKMKEKVLAISQVGGGIPWSAYEDQAIVAIVHDLGENWELVSDVLSSNSQLRGVFRRPKQCKERHKFVVDRSQFDQVGDRPPLQRLNGYADEETPRTHTERIAVIFTQYKQNNPKPQTLSGSEWEARKEGAMAATTHITQSQTVHSLLSNSRNGDAPSPMELAEFPDPIDPTQQVQQHAGAPVALPGLNNCTTQQLHPGDLANLPGSFASSRIQQLAAVGLQGQNATAAMQALAKQRQIAAGMQNPESMRYLRTMHQAQGAGNGNLLGNVSLPSGVPSMAGLGSLPPGNSQGMMNPGALQRSVGMNRQAASMRGGLGTSQMMQSIPPGSMLPPGGAAMVSSGGPSSQGLMGGDIAQRRRGLPDPVQLLQEGRITREQFQDMLAAQSQLQARNSSQHGATASLANASLMSMPPSNNLHAQQQQHVYMAAAAAKMAKDRQLQQHLQRQQLQQQGAGAGNLAHKGSLQQQQQQQQLQQMVQQQRQSQAKHGAGGSTPFTAAQQLAVVQQQALQQQGGAAGPSGLTGQAKLVQQGSLPVGLMHGQQHNQRMQPGQYQLNKQGQVSQGMQGAVTAQMPLGANPGTSMAAQITALQHQKNHQQQLHRRHIQRQQQEHSQQVQQAAATAQQQLTAQQNKRIQQQAALGGATPSSMGPPTSTFQMPPSTTAMPGSSVSASMPTAVSLPSQLVTSAPGQPSQQWKPNQPLSPMGSGIFSLSRPATSAGVQVTNISGAPVALAGEPGSSTAGLTLPVSAGISQQVGSGAALAGPSTLAQVPGSSLPPTHGKSVRHIVIPGQQMPRQNPNNLQALHPSAGGVPTSLPQGVPSSGGLPGGMSTAMPGLPGAPAVGLAGGANMGAPGGGLSRPSIVIPTSMGAALRSGGGVESPGPNQSPNSGHGATGTVGGLMGSTSFPGQPSMPHASLARVASAGSGLNNRPPSPASPMLQSQSPSNPGPPPVTVPSQSVNRGDPPASQQVAVDGASSAQNPPT